MIKVNSIQKNSPSFGANPVVIKKGLHSALNFCDEKISSPAQRLVIGGTAVVIQPWIDLANKDVDEKTRESSAARSVARAVIGTLTGIIIRSLAIDITKKHSQEGKIFFTEGLKKATEAQKKNYYGVIGTSVAVFVMLFTNFLLDVPGINWMQNLLMDTVFKHDDKNGGAK